MELVYEKMRSGGRLYIREHDYDGDKLFERYLVLVHEFWYKNESEDGLWLFSKEYLIERLERIGFRLKSSTSGENTMRVWNFVFEKPVFLP